MRYAALRADAPDPTPYNLHHRYFVALNLHQNEAILPDMITNLVHLAAFLGVDNVYISIFENGSEDRSKVLLNLAGSIFKVAGIEHSIVSSNRRQTKWDHRVAFLADVRNQAIEPLHALRKQHGITFDTVIFMNDVLYCLDDVLELIWQSRLSEATITCAVDFDSALDDPAIYDVWVGHDIAGDGFKKRPREEVISHGPDRDRWMRNSPFQAFCCWGGMAILDPEPLYHPHNIRFRMADIDNGECSASECSLLCKDYWTAGYGRVLVVPRVRLSYTKQIFDALHPLHPDVDGDLHNAYIPPHDLLFSNKESEAFAFRPGPEKVLCRGWQEAGFISMPDRQPVWERRPREIKNAIEIWHHRGFSDTIVQKRS